MIYEPIPGTAVIGIGHRARHGKDSLAAILLNEVKGARRYSFADDLKALARILGMDTKNGPVLQALGTDVCRSLDPDFWTKRAYWKLQEERPKMAIFPDVRFPNEVAMIRGMGGIVIKVLRLNADDSPFVASDRPADHPSETALDDYEAWDYCVVARTGELHLFPAIAQAILEDLNHDPQGS